MSGTFIPADTLAILAALPTPVVVLDRNLRFAYANPAHLSMFKLTWEGIRGRYVFDVFPENEARMEEVRRRFERVLAGSSEMTDAQTYRLWPETAMEEVHVWRAQESPLRAPDGSITHLVMVIQDISEQAALRRQQSVILAELEHRLRNTLAMVGSLAILTGHNTSNFETFIDVFTDRLDAMGRNLMMISDNHWQGLSFRKILEAEISEVISPQDPRICLDGPDFTFSVRSTKWTALLTHELLTNAVRYGCFAVPDGHLSVTWWIEEGNFIAEWIETGRRHDIPEERQGFGSHMLNLMPNMTTHRELREEGLYLRIQSPAKFIVPGSELSDITLAG